MEQAHKDFIAKTTYEARVLLGRYGDLSQLNALWAGSPNFDAQITQAAIDSVPSFAGAGLTVQQLADAEYTLSLIRANIEGALVALTMLANLPPA